MSETNGELETTGQATAIVSTQQRNEIASWTPRFAIGIDEAKQMVEAKRAFYKDVMKVDMHFGVIPGTDKPSLLKPGAELLLSSMGLHPEFDDDMEPVIDLQGKNTGGEPFVAFSRRCSIYRQTGPGLMDRMLIAAAGGYCSSWESKYRYRDQKRKCPSCGLVTIIKGKQFDKKKEAQGIAGDWVCWKKGGGCGSSFSPSGAEGKAIEKQVIGRIPNPDVADQVNTFKKMADKRALVAATLLATGCSDIFTQDVEDGAPEDQPAAKPPAEKAAPKTAPKARNAPARADAARPGEEARADSPPRHALGVAELIGLAKSIASEFGEVIDLTATLASFERSAKPGGPFAGFSSRDPRVMTPLERLQLEDHLMDIRDGLKLAAETAAKQDTAAEAPPEEADEEVNF